MELEFAERHGLWIFRSLADVPVVERNEERAWMIRERDLMSRRCRQRLFLGEVKHGESWKEGCQLGEAVEECCDLENYPFLEVVRLKRQMALRDGKPWPPGSEAAREEQEP